MPRCGATTDKKVGAARLSTNARATIGCLNRRADIAAGDSDSHFQQTIFVEKSSVQNLHLILSLPGVFFNALHSKGPNRTLGTRIASLV